MKCLLCNFGSNDQSELKERYIDLHNVDHDNKFFIKLFRKQNHVFCPRKCLRCSELLLNHRFKVNHYFLVHHVAGRDAYEEKPVNSVRIGEIQKYEITFAQHSQDYDFYNSEKLVDNLLLNVKHRVLVWRSNTTGNGNFNIMCGSSIENKQLSPFATNAGGVF